MAFVLGLFYAPFALLRDFLPDAREYLIDHTLSEVVRDLIWLAITTPFFWLRKLWRYLTIDTQTLLEETLHKANSFEEWEAAALQLDQSSGMDEWRRTDSGVAFSFEMIRQRTDALLAAIDARDVRQLHDILRCGLSRSYGGIIKPELYNKALAGTKSCVSDYVNATCDAISMITHWPSTQFKAESLSPQEKLDFLHDTRMSYGRSALVLQGGSIFGLCHLGVVKELLRQNVLPRIIAGSATGALMAALVGVHTDEELPAFLHGDGLNLRYFAASSMRAQQESLEYPPLLHSIRWIRTLYRRVRRYLSSGFILDPEVLGRTVQANIGDVTFEEAYQRTGRVLNITVTATGPGAITLLNYLTAPHVLIWSAAMVSNVADPRQSPLRLMCVDIDNSIKPYSSPSTRKFRQPRKQLDQESPLNRLGELFNVNHFIVSQARPYIVPLLYPSFRTSERTWSITTSLWGLIFEEARFRVRQANSMGLLAPGIKRLVMDEIVPGPSVTLVPEVTWYDWTRLLRNPTAEEINYWIRRGERSVWPLVKQLEIRLAVEFEIDRGYQLVRRGDDARLVEQVARQQREERARKRIQRQETSSGDTAL